jgi:glycosyltransferase involved in cell wall biosynthesis
MFRRLLLILGAFSTLLVGIASIAAPKQEKPILPKAETHKTICLNMIVKNESAIIADCLSSVKGLIDHWIIIDTGSSDGTQKIIKECMKGIPGTLYERPWVDFAHNRNEALALAKDKADYTLFIDADEKLLFGDNFTKPSLDQDLYYITVQQVGSSDYLRWFLINNKLNAHWQGVLHEELICPDIKSQAVIQNVVNVSDTTLGARSKNPQKYLDDAKTLVKGLEKEPNNSRYQFYLAQSYANGGELCLALSAYEKRAQMENGYPEETFLSLYIAARIKEFLNMPSSIVVRSYLKAHAHTPSRAEPLYYLGAYYGRMKKFNEAYTVLSKACNTPISNTDTLFVEVDLKAWRLPLLFAEVCWNMKKIPEMVNACQIVANSDRAPISTREEMLKNIAVVKENGWLDQK